MGKYSDTDYFHAVYRTCNAIDNYRFHNDVIESFFIDSPRKTLINTVNTAFKFKFLISQKIQTCTWMNHYFNTQIYYHEAKEQKSNTYVTSCLKKNPQNVSNS